MDSVDAFAPTIPMKPPRPDCPGIEVIRQPDRITVSRRWRRPKHFFFLVAVLVGWTIIGRGWSESGGASTGLIIASLFCLSWSMMVLSMFVNTTRVDIARDEIRVTHGPIPSPFGFPRSFQMSEVAHLFSASHGTQHAVRARLRSGEERILVAPLITSAQAQFVLAQANPFVPTYANDPQVAPPSESGSSSSAATKAPPIVAAVVPLFVIGILSLFYFMARSELRGTLTFHNEGGTFTLTPNECASGVPDGFGGVTLSANNSVNVVRVVNDPARGKLIVVVRPGQENQVFDGASCSQFRLDAHRTSTNINGVWVMEGALQVDCPDLRGRVEFAGCH